ncbi:MAG: mechanosensitive ion channel family protein [Actinobacteria bacterium]|nr:mechanosensitive ion channel family protein [Actinomycetota bacterium]
MTQGLEPRHLILAGSLLGGGLVLALLLQLLVFRGLSRRAAGDRSRGSDIAVRALGDVAVATAVLVGAYGAVVSLPLRQAVSGGILRLLLAASILAGTVVLARLAGDLVRHQAVRRAGVAQSTSIFVNVTRFVVLVVGVLMLLQTFGVSIAPMLTALGVGGLAVALALQDTLANLFAGIHILASRKVQPGDFIRLDSGEEGYVVDINWRNTTIRQLPNNMVMVPNARLAGAILVNYHRPVEEMSVLVQVGVAYDSDLEQVERVTIDVARDVLREVEGGVPGFDPFIRFHTFGDFSVDFTVILRAREFTDQYLITHEFVKRLHRRYRAEEIEIPFPIRTVELRSGREPVRRMIGPEVQTARR